MVAVYQITPEGIDRRFGKWNTLYYKNLVKVV
jgi:hypothetical protein